MGVRPSFYKKSISRHMNSTSNKSSLLIFMGVLCFAIVLNAILINRFDLEVLHRMGDLRLLTTADGWYYLRLAEELLSGTYAPLDHMRPLSPMAPFPYLSFLAAQFTKLTGISLQTVAFYFSCVVSVSIIPVMQMWAKRLEFGIWATMIASVFPLVSYAWFSRIYPGRFDTDCLILPLTMLAFWAVHDVVLSESGRRKVASILLLLATLLGLFLWWKQGAIAVGGICALVYVFSFPFVRSVFERRLQWGLIGVGLSVGGLCFTPVINYFPEFFVSLVDIAKSHIALIMGQEGANFFPSISNTIGELTVGSFENSLEWVFTLPLLVVPATIGAFWALFKRKSLLVAFCIPTLVFIFLSFTGRRFLMFLVPFAGLGLGAFVQMLSDYLHVKKLPLVGAITGILAIALVAPSVANVVKYDIRPTFDANRAVLASSAIQNSPEKAVVWSWWSDGYFLQYFAKRPTYIDGGSQTPMQAWIMSVPLASPDPVFARNWIRFFGAYPYALNQLAGKIGMEKAMHFFLAAFANKAQIETLVSDYGIEKMHNWNEYLFPNSAVVLFLPSDMMVKGTWLTFGRWVPGMTEKPFTPIYSQPTSKARVNVKNGTIAFSGVKLPFSKLLVVSKDELNHFNGQPDGQVFLTLEGIPKMYFMDKSHFDCLVFRLLFMYPDKTKYFKPLAYNPFVGGAWLVQ